MEDEIKEILRDLEFASGVFDYTITPDRCTFLKDYITNLQEESEKEKQFTKDCGFANQQQLALAYLDYKSRNKKSNRRYRFSN